MYVKHERNSFVANICVSQKLNRWFVWNASMRHNKINHYSKRVQCSLTQVNQVAMWKTPTTKRIFPFLSLNGAGMPSRIVWTVCNLCAFYLTAHITHTHTHTYLSCQTYQHRKLLQTYECSGSHSHKSHMYYMIGVGTLYDVCSHSQS